MYSTSSGGPSSLSCLALITSGQVITSRPFLIAVMSASWRPEPYSSRAPDGKRRHPAVDLGLVVAVTAGCAVQHEEVNDGLVGVGERDLIKGIGDTAGVGVVIGLPDPVHALTGGEDLVAD